MKLEVRFNRNGAYRLLPVGTEFAVVRNPHDGLVVISLVNEPLGESTGSISAYDLEASSVPSLV
jgi:hypothetical protein